MHLLPLIIHFEGIFNGEKFCFECVLFFGGDFVQC